MQTNTVFELSIIFPCLNEELTIGECIEEANLFLKENNVAGEVIVADNGSSDGSVEICENLGARVVMVPEKGYGAALYGGILSSKGKYAIMGDADMSYDMYHLEGILEELRNGADLVMGNRFKGGIEKGAMPFLHYYLGNPVLSFLGRLFYKNKIGDFHCGLRGFNVDFIKSLNLITRGMEFASEMVVKSTMNNAKIAEVPVVLRKDKRDRPPHLKTWRDGWRQLKFLLIHAPKFLYFLPMTIILLSGITITTLTFGHDIKLNSGPILGLNTFVSGLLLITLGIMFFGFLISINSISKSFKIKRQTFLTEKYLLNTDFLSYLGLIFIAIAICLGFYNYWVWSENNFQFLDNNHVKISMIVIFSMLNGIMLVLFSFLHYFISLVSKTIDNK
jgi:glycosyltransferase involved in cell wall biosynthesis